MSIIEKNMKNIAIINGIDLSPYTWEPLVREKTTINLVTQFGKTLPDIEKQVILASSSLENETEFEVFFRDEWNTEELFKSMEKLSSGYDNIFYFYADCPFLDPDLARKMFDNHIKYMADYTFADGYPYGLTTEIIKTDIIRRLIKLNKEEKNPVLRQSIFDIIKKDINSFDIETELAPRDQRLLRVWLSADTKRNFSLLQQITSKSAGSIDSQSVCTLLDKQPEILRTLPAYFSIQIIGGCPQKCTYCPYPIIGKKDGLEITDNTEEMEPDQFRVIIDAIKSFSEDAVISISPWGDPSRHSRIFDIAETVLENEKLTLIIETSGIGWKPDVLSRLARQKKNPVKWIVSLDAWSKDVYTSLRGQGFQEAYETAEILLGIDKDNVYVQAVRMKENEDDLEHFYLKWQKKTENIIIQKYDSFCNVLPDRKVTDLSPLKRFPCWHIKRDMIILIDGSVPLCREDTSSSIILGNVFHNTLPDIWEKGQTCYMDHVTGKYPEMCRKCDEYYTFNF